MATKILVIVTFACSISGCVSFNIKCCEYIRTDSISGNLFLERFRTVNAGVFGELTECYLTDSTSFRQKIGSYDEHESFYAELSGNKITAYNLASVTVFDTVAKKTITKSDLWKYHQNNSNCHTSKPLFGKNSLQCDTDCNSFSAYKTDDGIYISAVQYHCGNSYLNAVFYTDSQNFSVFVGVYSPGSFENNFKVSRKDKDSFDFYNITYRSKVDTTRAATFLMADLRKSKLSKVCN